MQDALRRYEIIGDLKWFVNLCTSVTVIVDNRIRSVE
jgi:hypothetical protein